MFTYKLQKLFVIPFLFYVTTYVESLPTFGNEYLHIKLHVPKEVHHAHVHHAAEEVQHIENPITVPEQQYYHKQLPAPAPHKVIHHYHRRRRPINKGTTNHKALLESLILSQVRKPIDSEHLKYINHGKDLAQHVIKPVETYIIEDEPKPKPQVDTFTVIEESTKPKPIVDTYKVVESNANYDDFDYKPKTHTETLKVIDYHDNDHEHNHHHYEQHHASHHYDSRRPSFVETTHGVAGSHYRKNPAHTKTVKIVETVETKLPLHTSSYPERPHSETIELTETKITAKAPSNFDRSPHTQQSLYQLPHRAHYHSEHSKPPISDGYEYENPKVLQSYAQGYTAPSSNSYAHGAAASVAAHNNDATYLLPPKTVYHHHQSNSENYHHNYDYQPVAPSLVDIVKQNTLYGEEISTNVGYDNDQFSDKYLPPHAEIVDHSNIANGADILWPEPEHKYAAAETYTGIDSYSADHVQGLGSGGYIYSRR